MTAPTPAVPDLLTRLEQLRAAATPGPWTHDVYEDHASRRRFVAETGWRPDAALIVAAVNALPSLVSALRAVAELAEELEAEAQQQVDDSDSLASVVGRSWVNAARQFRAVLTAALDPAHDDERQDRQ
jgi:hypothetical protein